MRSEVITEQEAQAYAIYLQTTDTERASQRMRRIQVRGRQFGYKAGNSFVAVKEYRKDDVPRHLLTFAIPRPDMLTRQVMRSAILERMQAAEIMQRPGVQNGLKKIDEMEAR